MPSVNVLIVFDVESVWSLHIMNEYVAFLCHMLGSGHFSYGLSFTVL